MITKLVKGAEALTAWPRDIADSLHYHTSRISALGRSADELDEDAKTLPSSSKIHRAFSSKQSVSDRGLHDLWADARFLPRYSCICTDLRGIKHLLDLGATPTGNPVLQRSLMELGNRLVPLDPQKSTLQSRLSAAIAVGKARQQIRPKPWPGVYQNRCILHVMTCLQEVASHPSLANIDLDGRAPARRQFTRDIASMLCFTVVAGLLPVWVGLIFSPKKGVALSLFGIALGSHIYQRLAGQTRNEKSQPPGGGTGDLVLVDDNLPTSVPSEMLMENTITPLGAVELV